MSETENIWNDVDRIVYQQERQRALAALERREQCERDGKRDVLLLESTGPYLTVLGAAVLGIGTGIACLMFNFLLFVVILHVSF